MSDINLPDNSFVFLGVPVSSRYGNATTLTFRFAVCFVVHQILAGEKCWLQAMEGDKAGA